MIDYFWEVILASHFIKTLSWPGHMKQCFYQHGYYAAPTLHYGRKFESYAVVIKTIDCKCHGKMACDVMVLS